MHLLWFLPGVGPLAGFTSIAVAARKDRNKGKQRNRGKKNKKLEENRRTRDRTTSLVVITQTVSATVATTPSVSIFTSPTPSSSPENAQQSRVRSTQLTLLGAVLGSLFGILVILSLVLFYIRHRRRKSSRGTPNIGFDNEKMVSRRWWHSSRYNFGDAKRSQIDSDVASQSEYQSEWDDTSESLAPSDSASQIRSKSKRNLDDIPPMPPLPSKDPKVVSEKVEGERS
ncbi:hypothetical protein WG66_012901 [Moniliophthora roreri]|nr:hypothetical protein WG66_012901 [Moniliophthora roreri]